MTHRESSRLMFIQAQYLISKDIPQTMIDCSYCNKKLSSEDITLTHDNCVNQFMKDARRQFEGDY